MKRVILLTWKNGETEIFGNLSKLCKRYSGISKHSVEHYISRLKKVYEDEDCKIERKEVH